MVVLSVEKNAVSEPEKKAEKTRHRNSRRISVTTSASKEYSDCD